MLSNSETRYGAVSRALHSIMALAIIGLIIVGWTMGNLADDNPARGTVYGLHKATGVVVLFLAVIRLAWLGVSPAPALPSSFDAKEKILAKLVKLAFYLLMFLVPVSGMFMSQFADKPISIYGLATIPMFVEPDKDMAKFFYEMHELCVIILMVAIALHVAGAIKHRRSGDPEKDVLKRMFGRD